MRIAAVASVSALLVACGVDGTRNPPPDPPVTQPEPPPAGGDGGAPPPQGGTPQLPPDTSTPPAIHPSVAIERTDAHPECDGLLPSRASAPLVAKVEQNDPYRGSCSAAPSDGGGHVAVQTVDLGPARSWRALAPDTTPGNVFYGSPPLLTQASGWLVCRGGGSDSNDPGIPSLEAIAPDGSVRGRDTLSNPGGDFRAHGWGCAGDPAGGALLVTQSHTMNDQTPPGVCASEFVRFDGTGARISVARDVACVHHAIGVSNAGEAVVIEDHQDGDFVTWLAREGSVARGRTRIELDPNLWKFELYPLLDGSLAAAHAPFQWMGRIERLGTALGPPPAWLTDRAGRHFRFTRGNRGYAVFPPRNADSSDCSATIELLAPSGRTCGTVTLRGTGSPCTGGVDQGWDGTVTQITSAVECTVRWWPRLLAGD